ncbi:hypothetical protein CDAR_418351 [Caerostris darwini]|uniref:Uncharacterized protein n=1 Tax=Caerostris darwini TaxID=1538125 RepID=A0AAV4WIC5_9ARAC|nr:hypothetical protein CDAR_418351 [Caerostris darwini]
MLQAALAALNFRGITCHPSAPRSECQSFSLLEQSRYQKETREVSLRGNFSMDPEKAESGGDAKDQQSYLLPFYYKNREEIKYFSWIPFIKP